MQVNVPGLMLATYFYDAAGNKLRNVSNSGGTWDYEDGIVYQNGRILFINTEEGRATLSSSDSLTYNYNSEFKDYLGNVRASYDNGGTGGTARLIQENDYFPFGLTTKYYDFANNNRYLYNGKELQTDLTEQYDYGSRFYDPVIGRWTSVDIKADSMRKVSPYNYGFDNPIRFIDPDGRAPDPGDLFATEDEAAIDFAQYYNGASISAGVEYASTTYQVTGSDGKTYYTYTAANTGTKDGSTPSTPGGGQTVVAIDHTHGNYIASYGKGNDEFSGTSNTPGAPGQKTDISVAKANGLDDYVGTPNGKVQKFDVKTGKISTLSIAIPSDSTDPGRTNKIAPTKAPYSGQKPIETPVNPNATATSSTNTTNTSSTPSTKPPK